MPGDATAEYRSHGPGWRRFRAAHRNGHARIRSRGDRRGASSANGRGRLGPDTGQLPGLWEYFDSPSQPECPTDIGTNAYEQPVAHSHVNADAREQPATGSYIDAHADTNAHEQPAAQSHHYAHADYRAYLHERSYPDRSRIV